MTDYKKDLKNYKILKKIGQGAFSEVYCVKEKSSGEIFAVKISLKEEMRIMAGEVNIISKLKHPSILKFIGYSDLDLNNDRKPSIITEYSANGSLEKILKLERSGRSLPEWDQTKKLIVIYGIAAGMDYLHSHKVIHRDLKPDNIFLDENLYPKIGDFGLSKLNRNQLTMSSISTASGIKGTPMYIAPEIWNDIDHEREVQYTEKCDVYSFALIVYEIVTSEIPFANCPFMKLIHKVCQNERPKFKFPIPDSYRKLIEDCWSQDPSLRPSFKQIVERLIITNEGFITEDVEINDFNEYVELIDKSFIDFKADVDVIKIKVKPVFPEEDLMNLKSNCQRIVRESENDIKKQFIIGKSFIEGIIGFPKNLELGITYLEAALKNGSIDSCIYYCRLLIEGKLIPPNPNKAGKCLKRFLRLENATIYALYGKAMKAEHKYEEAIEYFQKSSSLGNGEAMFEYVSMFLKGEGIKRDASQASQFIEMVNNNFFQKKEKEGKRRKSSIKLRFIKPSTFDKLNESCQNSVLSAESDDVNALVYVARGFIEGSNDFPHKTELGLKYLKHGVELKNVESMQLYCNILMNGEIITKDEDKEKGISDLYKAASILKNSEMILQLVKILLNNQSFAINSTDNMNVNFPLAKKYYKEAADAGNTKAMVLYGRFCMKEKKCKYGEINSDFKEAFNYFKLAAEKGDGEGMAHYGRFLDFGYGVVKPNPVEAVKLYRKSYEKGDLTGYTFYGSALIEGSGIQKNEAEGIQHIKYSCDNGNIYGFAQYGYFLNKGGTILTKDVNQSFKYYKMAADLGCNVALSNIGICYRDGTGVKKDVKTAIKYFKLAIEEGYPRSALILGNLYLNGDDESSIKPDIKEGMKYVQYAADHGNKIAMYLLAYSMYSKKCIEMDPVLLKKYLLNGIELGYAPCMRLYGKILIVGDVLPQNKYEGVKYIKMAADLGDGKAMELYADALENGEGVLKNKAEARRYKKMALDASKSAE